MRRFSTRILFGFVALLTSYLLPAQDADLPLNHEAYHYIDRLDITGALGETVHTDYKPYSRAAVSEIFSKASTEGYSDRDQAWFDLMRIAADDDYADEQKSKGVLKKLYRNGRDFFSFHKEKARLYINPIGILGVGGDQQDYTTGLNGDEFLLNYRNTRGVRVRGTAFKRLGFFTEFTENQWKTPVFIRNQQATTGVLDGENFVKVFDAPTGNPGFDYFNARGYITYAPAKELRLKFGKDRAFLGNGYQSLLLSDHATDYFFLNIQARIWKLEYVSHFTQMTDFIRGKPDSYGVYPRKYAVFHMLSYKPWHWLSVGAFESVVYSPTLPGGQRGFELEYMNPIIFYRSVEQSLGSPDNAMLGLNWKANLLQRFQVYGQIMLDDFNFRNRDLGTGYWGNKYGWQVGMKYINAFWVPRLDLQLEYNRIRPYTYQHFNPTANYAHYGQPLAHAMGANLYDVNLILRYQPFPRWSGQLLFTRLTKGLDIDGENYGGDISIPYTLRVQDFNNVPGQGDQLNITNIQGRISYRLLRLDAYADLEARYRKENQFTSMSVMGSLRFNMPNRPVRY
jgi:hypothetical protein